MISGCNSGKMTPVKTTPTAPAETTKTTNGSAPVATQPAVEDRCSGLLVSAVDMMQPERLGISSTIAGSVEVMNNWLLSCGNGESAAKSTGASFDEWAKVLTDDQKQRLTQTRVDTDDVEHVRDCIMDRKATDVVTKGATDDLDRVVRLFYHVVRNIALVPSNDQRLMTPPYETLMFGRGTAEDRAWIFANLLRQLRIDVVIVQPAGNAVAESKPVEGKSSSEKPADAKPASSDAVPTPAASGTSNPGEKPWLVGVLLNKQVYLFDMRLGWPIPSLADTGKTAVVRQPATLKEVVSDDSLLRRLDRDAERPYSLRAADLKSPRVELITEVLFWTERMRRLQDNMPLVDGRTVVVFDGLSEIGAGKGIVTRVVEGGEGLWSREQVSLWPHPEKCRTASHNLTPVQSNELKATWFPYQAPVSVDFNAERMQPDIGKPGYSQLKTRISQVIGEYSTAIKSYLAVQLAEYPPVIPLSEKTYNHLLEHARNNGIAAEKVPNRFQVPQDVLFMHYRAAEDAKYWVAISQYDLGDYHAAVDSFENYRKRYSDKGLWTGSAAVLRANAQAEDNRLAEAIYSMTQALKLLPEDHPQRAGFELLEIRWRNARKAAASEKNETAK